MILVEQSIEMDGILVLSVLCVWGCMYVIQFIDWRGGMRKVKGRWLGRVEFDFDQR